MTNIAHVADMAVLAEASYANLLLENDIYDELQSADFGAGQSFSATQAAEFVTNWTVVNHQPDTSTGFSATVFQSKNNGEYTLAIRGTAQNDIDLIGADLGNIVLDGLAVDQVADLYNLSSCCLERRVNTNSLGAAA